MPICDALYRVIFEELDPMEVLNELFKRSVKEENAPASRYAL
jgi:glycerol-3-phosphate dehydrogenase